MMEKKVNVSGEFIQLNQLLKLENVVSSGGEAKALIESGKVLVNGEKADAVRKKLRQGDTVRVGHNVWVIELTDVR
ncbi:MAG: RNA-binding S4 domain-containing protein [Firmicutes bacterium]|jgi:ribosome-associated protein|nr:RNA-binding S4 domain-containing protein [Bacillota bacterium]MBR3393886.1 RNA-binding S4 domain-containing protein [Bacillota bacterium]